MTGSVMGCCSRSFRMCFEASWIWRTSRQDWCLRAARAPTVHLVPTSRTTETSHCPQNSDSVARCVYGSDRSSPTFQITCLEPNPTVLWLKGQCVCTKYQTDFVVWGMSSFQPILRHPVRHTWLTNVLVQATEINWFMRITCKGAKIVLQLV